MALPPEVKVRAITGTFENQDGTPVASGIVTFTPVPGELICRTSKVSIFTQPTIVAVANGTLTLPNAVNTAPLICGDGYPTVDAGTGGSAWSYQVTRSWDGGRPFNIILKAGPLGTTADPAVDISDLVVPAPSGPVGVVSGPAGRGVTTVTASGGVATVTYTDGTTSTYPIPGPSTLTESPPGSGLYLIGA